MKKIATNWRRIVAEKQEVEWKIEHTRKVQPRILGEPKSRELKIMEWLRI
jgi:nicotinate-nucleotide pyrophosphorylase